MQNPNGYGKLYKKNGSLYVGCFSNGKAEGQGTLIFPDGSYARGSFHNNMLKKGEYSSSDFKYIGDFQNNLFHGLG